MKKRIYYIISSIVASICSVYSLFTVNEIVDTNLKYIPDLTVSLDFIENVFFYFIIITTSVIIFMNLLLFIISFLNKLDKYKWIIIVFSVFSCLFSESAVVLLLGIFNLILLDYKDDKKKKKKKEVFKPKEVYSLKERICLSSCAIVLYFSVPLVISIFKLNYFFSDLMSSLVLMVIMFLMFYEMLKKDFLYFKKNYKKCIKYVLKSQVTIAIIYVLSALVLSLIMGDNLTESINQTELNKYPFILLFFLSTIYAPFVEELVFRGAIRRLIKKDYLFIIVSGLIFGALHVIYEPTIIRALVMMIPYAALGATFAYFYTKSDNILFTMSNHFIHNFIAVILTFLFK